MNWVCDVCSTVNAKESKECFVCGQIRSKTAIKEARRLAGAEKKAGRDARTYKILTTGAKVLFVASLALCAVIAVTFLILKMIRGQVSDVVVAVIEISKRIGGNIGLMASCAVSLVKILWGGFWTGLWDSVLSVLRYGAARYADHRQMMSADWWSHMHGRCEELAVVYNLLVQQLATQAKWLLGAMAAVFHYAVENVAAVGDSIKGIFENAKENAVQFQ